MWREWLRLIGLSDSADPIGDQYDPVYGLPRRSLEEWLARNPDVKDEYEAELRRRAVRHDGSKSTPPASSL
jgi:hypothetical protein